MSWRASSRTLDGDIVNTTEDSATPKPSLTAFTRGDISLEEVTLLAVVAKNEVPNGESIWEDYRLHKAISSKRDIAKMARVT